MDQVRDGNCPNLAQEKPQEAASSPSKPSVNSTSAINSWKLQKWLTAAGQEDCNLYQRKLCNLGEACKRAHMCKACRGYHPQADCPRCTGNQVTVLTCRPGANVYEHTQTLILWLIYCMTLKLECTFAINPLPVLFKHATIIYLRELIPSPWLARMNVNLSWTVKLDHFLLRPFSILLVHLWVRSLRSTQIQSSGV